MVDLYPVVFLKHSVVFIIIIDLEQKVFFIWTKPIIFITLQIAKHLCSLSMHFWICYPPQRIYIYNF